jgi:hypothetical protein
MSLPIFAPIMDAAPGAGKRRVEAAFSNRVINAMQDVRFGFALQHRKNARCG